LNFRHLLFGIIGVREFHQGFFGDERAIPLVWQSRRTTVSARHDQDDLNRSVVEHGHRYGVAVMRAIVYNRSPNLRLSRFSAVVAERFTVAAKMVRDSDHPMSDVKRTAWKMADPRRPRSGATSGGEEK